MSEFEIPSGTDYYSDFDYQTIESFYNEALIHQNSSSRKYSKRSLNLKITEDKEGIGDDVIIETDDLHKVFHNYLIFDYLEKQFFHYNWEKERYSSVGVTIHVKDKTYTGEFRFNKTKRFYTVHLREFSKDWAERDLDSSNVKDWLTDYGIIQFEAIKAQFASGNAVSFGELLAPEGMLIFVEYKKLFYLIDGDTHWRISYSDYEAAIKEDASNYREVKIKKFKDNRHYGRLDDEKVRVYLTPDRRQVKATNFDQEQLEQYAEMGVTPPKEKVSKRSGHIELNTPMAFAGGTYFRRLEKDQKTKRSLKGQDMILLLNLFEAVDQIEFKKDENSYLRQYVYKRLDRDEMARAVLHFDTSIFSLKLKLQYVRNAGLGDYVNIDSVRPLLAQYPKSKQLAAKHSKRKTGEEEVNIKQLIRESEYNYTYEPMSFRSGKYDEVLDESNGFVGLDVEDVQDRLLRLYDTSAWYNLYKSGEKNKEAAGEKLAEIGEKYDHNNVFTATSLYETDRLWYLKFFRSNALKVAFTMLNTAEQVIQEQTHDYFGYKYYALERDFLTYQEALETLISTKSTVEYENTQNDIKEFVVKNHAFLIDLEIDGYSSNTLGQIGRIYKKYKEKPKNFKDYFLKELSRSMADRLNSINETKEKLRADPMFVWELESLIAMTRNYMHSDNNAVLDKIIANEIKKQNDDEFKKNIGLAIGAITLTILSGGLAAAGLAPILATTFGAGALVVSGEMVYEAHKNDSALNHAHNIGNQYTPYGTLTKKDPELGWLIFDIALLGLDMFGVIKVYKTVSPIAKIVSKTDWTCNIILDTKLSHAACLLLFISSSNSLIVL